MVALTQFLLWIAFIFVIYNVSSMGSKGGGASQLIGSVQAVFTSINLPLTLFCFAFYFLGGFFFYASIYGAIGSAINEDVREAQSLSFPVTMIVIISIVLMTTAVNDPTGPVATVFPMAFPVPCPGGNCLPAWGYWSWALCLLPGSRPRSTGRVFLCMARSLPGGN
jgi:ABC-2 type transport system permease protein